MLFFFKESFKLPLILFFTLITIQSNPLFAETESGKVKVQTRAIDHYLKDVNRKLYLNSDISASTSIINTERPDQKKNPMLKKSIFKKSDKQNQINKLYNKIKPKNNKLVRLFIQLNIPVQTGRAILPK